MQHKCRRGWGKGIVKHLVRKERHAVVDQGVDDVHAVRGFTFPGQRDERFDGDLDLVVLVLEDVGVLEPVFEAFVGEVRGVAHREAVDELARLVQAFGGEVEGAAR